MSGQQAAQTEKPAHVRLVQAETKAAPCPSQTMCGRRKRRRQRGGKGRKRATAEKEVFLKRMSEGILVRSWDDCHREGEQEGVSIGNLATLVPLHAEQRKQ